MVTSVGHFISWVTEIVVFGAIEYIVTVTLHGDAFGRQTYLTYDVSFWLSEFSIWHGKQIQEMDHFALVICAWYPRRRPLDVRPAHPQHQLRRLSHSSGSFKQTKTIIQAVSEVDVDVENIPTAIV